MRRKGEKKGRKNARQGMRRRKEGQDRDREKEGRRAFGRFEGERVEWEVL